MNAGNDVVVKSSGMDPTVVLGLIFGVIIVGGFLWGLYMMYKQKNNQVASAATKERAPERKGKEEDKSTRPLADTRWLVRNVERIEDGIVVIKGGKRFVTGITCRGIDLYNAGINEQLSTMRGYQKFYNIVENPITYRQYCKAIDLDIPKGRYLAKYKEVMQEYEHYIDALQNAKGHNAPEEELQRLAISANRCERRLKHFEEQMNSIEYYSGSDVSMDVMQTYIFDWSYTPGVSEVRLTDEEIFLRAKTELSAIATRKIDALMESGVKGRICTQDEMVDMFRHHSKPIGAENYKQKMLRDSSFEEDIVTSDSLEEASKALYEEDVKGLYEGLFGSVEVNNPMSKDRGL